MRALVRERERAILLRKKGYSYRDILREIPVSKSSISLWLQNLPLTKDEKEYLRSRRDSNISRGRMKAASALHTLRLERDNHLLRDTEQLFKQYSTDTLFQIGIALYWAEGSKRTNVFSFANSDLDMIDLMLEWIERFLFVPRHSVKVRLYLHKPFAHEHCEERWAKQIDIPMRNFQKTIFKPTGRLVKKRPDYKGCLRIELGKTSNLRRMQFLQQMLLEYHRR